MPKNTPSSMIRQRLAHARKSLRSSKAEALLITNRFDHVYLTGFTGEDSAVLITPKDVHLISDGRFETSIGQEAPWAKVSLRKGSLLDEIATVAKSYRLRSVALQFEYFTVAERDALAKKMRGVKLVAAPPICADMRILKDAKELALIEKATRIAEAAYRETLKSLRLGQTELEIAARLEYEMKRRGSTSPAFDSIVALDANSALPHAVPGNQRLKRGSTLLLDWGATFAFYRSDLTRTVFIGSIPPAMEEVYVAVLAAQKKAIAAIRPGARMCDVDAVARDHIAGAGYADFFNHGLGHGLGLDVHEPPSLRWSSTEKCRAGMVVTVEPGIYLPGVGGVRIEDDVLVTKTGRRVLSRLNKSLSTAVVNVAR